MKNYITTAYGMSYQQPMTMAGPVNPYGIPVDANGNPTLSQGASEQLYCRAKLMEQNTYLESCLEHQRHNNKMEEIQLKAYVDSKRDEAIQLRKLMREDSVVFPVLDSNSRICLERCMSNDKKEVGKPIFETSNIYLKVIKSIQTREAMYYLLGWDDLDKEIKIPKSKMNPNNLFREMSMAGNPMRVGKNRKTEIGDLIFGYLLANAYVLYIPEHWGWGKQEGNWVFCEETNLKGDR